MLDDPILRMTAVQEKIMAESGMSAEELREWEKQEVAATLQRIKELDVNPWVNNHPSVVEIEAKAITRFYRVVYSRGKGFKQPPEILTVGVSLRLKGGKLWHHVSVSKPNSVPTYYELVFVKNIFIGDEEAIQVFPEKEDHVNIHANCLHLWRCLEENPLPKFAVFGSI